MIQQLIETKQKKAPTNKEYEQDLLFIEYANSRVYTEPQHKLVSSNIQLKNKIATGNAKLVSYIIEKHYDKISNEVSKEDMFQEGMIGLLDAIDRFEPSLGFRFSTYSTWWIKQSIVTYLKANKNLTHVPSHIMNQYSKSNKELKPLGKTVINNIHEFKAKDLGITEKMYHCISMLRGTNALSVSIDEKSFNDKSNTEQINDFLFKALSTEGTQELEFFSEQAKSAIKKSLESLSARERNVLLLRFNFSKELPSKKSYPSTVKKGSYITTTDGLDYRTIAKIMTEHGFPMNHATARNTLVSGYTEFFIKFLNEMGVPTFNKKEVELLAKNQAVHDILPDIFYTYKPFANNITGDNTHAI